MKLNKITTKDLEVQIHHIGGIGNSGPTEILTGINEFAHWTFYDADKDALKTITGNKGKKFTLINKCINNYDGQGNFHTMLTPTASSMLKPAQSAKDYIRKDQNTTWGEQTQIVKTEKIQVHKLDTLLKSGEIRPIDFLSVDAQGADLSIIKGTNLKHVMGVMVEVEFSQLYEGQPLFFDVHKHMHDNDFRFCLLFNSQLMSVRKYIQSKGFTVVGEALFFKDPTKLINELPNMDIDERTKTVIQILKLCAIVACYDQLDHTMNILEQLGISLEELEKDTDSFLGTLLRIQKEITRHEQQIKEKFKEIHEYRKWQKRK